MKVPRTPAACCFLLASTAGGPRSEGGGDGDAEQHRVTLSRSAWMAETEVTQGLWATVAGDGS